MDKSMSPSASVMTDGQIDKAADVFRAIVRKHRSGFVSNAVQQVLGTKGFAKDLLATFRKHVEAEGNPIVRIVTVNRDLTPEETLKATGQRQYVTDAVVKGMPRGEGDKAEVVFFKPSRSLTNSQLEKEFDLRGLKPADPYALIAVNDADPDFATKTPNATVWKDADGTWCYIAFNPANNEPGVIVGQTGGWAGARWSFGGVRLPAQAGE